MKSKLLVTELWGLGDLVIASPFLRAASARFDVTLLAKPYALDLRARFWPDVRVRPFVAPWTAFHHKYRVWRWPWAELGRLLGLRKERFDIGLSGRWDPRDHALIWVIGARRRLGYPRLKSSLFLTESLERPEPTDHRYEYWRKLGHILGLELPARQNCFPLRPNRSSLVLVHSGAGQPVRVWPLVKYRNLVLQMRSQGIPVAVACDPDQRTWWTESGERDLVVPRRVSELLELFDRSGVFIGNDSGPAHLAAAAGLPTLTLFGPQLPEWFAPMGQGSTWLEGKPCPYKPCSDYCRFPVPYCLANVKEEEAWKTVEPFLQRFMSRQGVNAC